MTKKKPWNRINLPVYSISTKGDEASNMNIITYASQISMRPKRFICGIYEGTKTLDNANSSKEFVLQLLAEKQYSLVNLLGKKSGHIINKVERLKKRNELAEWRGFDILKNCLAVIHLKVINEFDGGDHKGFLCDAVAYKNINEGKPLTLDTLRKHKIISI